LRLVDLNPRWFGAGGEGIYNSDMTPAEERRGIGISFDCPCNKCREMKAKADKDDWPVGRHFIMFTNPIDGKPTWKSRPDDPTWNRVGDTFDTLQLSPSILSDPSKGGCSWHGYIGLSIPGEVTTC